VLVAMVLRKENTENASIDFVSRRSLGFEHLFKKSNPSFITQIIETR
jgi:hypothetical protein